MSISPSPLKNRVPEKPRRDHCGTWGNYR
jgi:hypothetical protein